MTLTRYSLSKDKVKSDEGAVVVVDTVGDLNGIYGRSELAFVEAAGAYGGQNILEPSSSAHQSVRATHRELPDIGMRSLTRARASWCRTVKSLGKDSSLA